MVMIQVCLMLMYFLSLVLPQCDMYNNNLFIIPGFKFDGTVEALLCALTCTILKVINH